MTLIKPEDLLSNEEYKRQRPERVQKIITIKNRRRLEVGPWVSVIFENRDTVIHQIQEMLLIENLKSATEIAHEIETYSELLPGPGELSATLFIEIDDAQRRHEALRQLLGIENSVRLKIGNELRQAEDKRPIEPRFQRPQASAVYYLRFPIEKKSLKQTETWLEIAHPAYRHAAALSPELIAELSREI